MYIYIIPVETKLIILLNIEPRGTSVVSERYIYYHAFEFPQDIYQKGHINLLVICKFIDKNIIALNR